MLDNSELLLNNGDHVDLKNGVAVWSYLQSVQKFPNGPHILQDLMRSAHDEQLIDEIAKDRLAQHAPLLCDRSGNITLTVKSIVLAGGITEDCDGTLGLHDPFDPSPKNQDAMKEEQRRQAKQGMGILKWAMRDDSEDRLR